MKQNNVKKFLFSSSATIYGEPKYLPIDEIHPLNAINPYGETKLIVEKCLRIYQNQMMSGQLFL